MTLWTLNTVAFIDSRCDWNDAPSVDTSITRDVENDASQLTESARSALTSTGYAGSVRTNARGSRWQTQVST